MLVYVLWPTCIYRHRRNGEEAPPTNGNNVKLCSQHLVMCPSTLATKHVAFVRCVVCHRRYVVISKACDRCDSRRTSLEVNLHVQSQGVQYIRTRTHADTVQSLIWHLSKCRCLSGSMTQIFGHVCHAASAHHEHVVLSWTNFVTCTS